MYKNIEKVIDTVLHFLKYDDRTRNNDLLLQMRVCERTGYIKHLTRTCFGSGWFFKEHDVTNGRIPAGIMGAISRSRRKVQEEKISLRADPEIHNKKLMLEEEMRDNIKNLEIDKSDHRGFDYENKS